MNSLNLKSQDMESLQANSALIEAHHRVKNTLQNIISYVNIMFAERETIGKDDIKKLTRYLYALSSIHDLLLDAVLNSTDATFIRFDRVLSDLVQLRSVEEFIEFEEPPSIFLTARRAATVSLILSELIDNAFRHGKGAVRIEIETLEDEAVVIKIKNSLAIGSKEQFKMGTGLRFCELLAKAELGSFIELRCSANTFEATIRIPKD